MTPAAQFFGTLYAGHTGILELRTWGPEDDDQSPQAKRQRSAAYYLRDFVPVVDGHLDYARIEKYLAGCERAELGAFFGVALRVPSSGKDRSGDAAHCQTLTALFVDADFKYAETRKKLAEYPIPPTIVVNSGGGLHPYWLLRQSLDLQRDHPGAQSILRRLAYSVAAIVDTSVSEPTRVLRIPSSLNYKYDPPRPVTLEQLTDARIDPAGLPLIEMATSSGSTSGGSGQPFHMPASATGEHHERRPMFRDMTRCMQSHGVTEDGCKEACRIENLRLCKPPHDDAVVNAYVSRVFHLADRPGWVRHPKTGWELAGSLCDVGLSVKAVLAAVRSVTPDFDPEVSE